jgi:hypothetical protein
MNIFKLLTITLFFIFSSLTSITYADTLKFDASSYQGEVKKGKAHGVGMFTFLDGSTYEGQVSKNRIHGNGKFTDTQGKVYEGKFRYGTFTTKIDSKTRDVIKLKPKKGIETFSEMRGKDSAFNSWFEATKNSSGIYELTDEGAKKMEEAIAASKDDDGGGGGGGC